MLSQSNGEPSATDYDRIEADYYEESCDEAVQFWAWLRAAPRRYRGVWVSLLVIAGVTINARSGEHGRREHRAHGVLAALDSSRDEAPQQCAYTFPEHVADCDHCWLCPVCSLPLSEGCAPHAFLLPFGGSPAWRGSVANWAGGFGVRGAPCWMRFEPDRHASNPFFHLLLR